MSENVQFFKLKIIKAIMLLKLKNDIKYFEVTYLLIILWSS
jgi:hypothetical protein